MIEKKLGQGEVLLFLTTLAPDWNDWAKNPSFVVVVLKMQSYLATAKRLDDPRLVGTPLDLALEAAKYPPDLAFVVPGEKAGSRQKIERQATSPPKPAPHDARRLARPRRWWPASRAARPTGRASTKPGRSRPRAKSTCGGGPSMSIPTKGT